MSTKLKFIKIREVQTPEYGTIGSAGIDFFVPKDFVGVHLKPNESVLIPSGIKARVPDNMVLIAFNKSGVATKKRLVVGAEVVDSDYQGEIHLHVYNTGTADMFVEPNDKIMQFILLPYIHAELDECLELEEVFTDTTSRGEKGFGSTGDKANPNGDYYEALNVTGDYLEWLDTNT